MRTSLGAGLALLATMLAACGGGLRSGEPVDQVYVLRAAAREAGAPAVPGVLAVPRPLVAPGLDSDRIALVRGGNELDHFAASRWGEALPRVVAALAVQELGGSGGFASVVDAGRSSVASDYELLLTVRSFEAAYQPGSALPEVRVVIGCMIAAGAPRRMLGRCDASATEQPDGNRMGAIVAAMERAAQRALAEVRAQAAAAVRK